MVSSLSRSISLSLIEFIAEQLFVNIPLNEYTSVLVFANGDDSFDSTTSI